MGKGIGLRHVFVVGAVGRLAFLGEDHRHIVQVAQHGGKGNAAGLDGKHLVDFHPRETPFHFVSHLTHDADVDLMVQEIVNLQYVAWFDGGIAQDFFFQKIHGLSMCYKVIL